jgi:hypothetical protein
MGIQRQVAHSVVAIVQYVGTRGWDQSIDIPINTLQLTAPNPNDPLNPTPGDPYGIRHAVATGTLTPNYFRQFPGFSSITQETNEGNFNYNSLQAGMRMENRHGLTVQLAYTYSHEIDTNANDLNAASNPFNLAYDRGSGQFDRRHIFNANYVYTLPFFANTSSHVLHGVLGGWQFSGITIAQSGSPVNSGNGVIYTGPDTLGLGGGTRNRPDQVAPVSYPHTVDHWFSASSFAAPLAPWAGGTNQGFGSTGKDAVVGPGLFNFNMSLFKTFAVTERVKFELRFESFNTFNHTEFLNVDTNSGDANFGAATSTYDPRVLQLGAKLSF